MRHDIGIFNRDLWYVPGCYSNQAYDWEGEPQMNCVGVWGGTGPAVQCVLECVAEQLSGPLYKHGNCNMPAVNYCVSYSSCQDVARVHENPTFINPPRAECREHYPIIHIKCYDTEYKISVSIINDEVVLTEKVGISDAQKAVQGRRQKGIMNREKRKAAAARAKELARAN